MSDQGDRTDYTAIADLPADAQAVLIFWFHELTTDQWFSGDAAVDAQIATRFQLAHRELVRGIPAPWLGTAHGKLAAVIVLDQFSRNLFREDARAFAQDSRALAITKAAIDAGQDERLSVDEKTFLYMPLMHSEKLADVRRCTALMEAAGATESAEFSRRHAETIASFGRYPARNEALGRESTPAERAFLAANPAGF